ncbi:hypothetical protein MMC13_000473 [Lambiella insularis]|nr:hypothetical protein [Lambiella insularis]
MTQLFISRAELMPPGETTNEHLIAKEEEANIVERDRSNTDARSGGLFRGCFRALPYAHVIQDVEDGVTRCPLCSWELIDGFCNGCERHYDSGGAEFYDESDDSDLDQSGSDLDLSEDYPDMGGEVYIAPHEHHDDISLDGDGLGVHTPNYTGDFTFGRAAAQGLIGRPINRNDSPATAQNRRRYAPSMLSDVATTQNDGDDFSGTDEVDEEDDETSLDGFLVNDEDTGVHNFDDRIPDFDDESSRGSPRSTQGSSRSSTRDRDEHGTPFDHEGLPVDHTEELWVDDSVVSSDHQTQTEDDGSLRSSSHSSDESAESEAVVSQPQSRKRRRTVVELSSGDDSDSETDSERSRPRRRLSSSGSTTIGRQSPVLGSSRAIPTRPMSGRGRRSEASVQSISSNSDSYVAPIHARSSWRGQRGLQATRSPEPAFAPPPRNANPSYNPVGRFDQTGMQRRGSRGPCRRSNRGRSFQNRGFNAFNPP